MKLLTTSIDASYISEIANYLHSHDIAVHVDNRGTSSLPGSGSYQQSIFILSEEQYEDAISLLKEGGYWEEPEITVATNNKSLLNNQWVVFVLTLLVAILFASVIL